MLPGLSGSSRFGCWGCLVPGGTSDFSLRLGIGIPSLGVGGGRRLGLRSRRVWPLWALTCFSPEASFPQVGAACLVHFPEGYPFCEASLRHLKVYDCPLVGCAGLQCLWDLGSAVVAVVWAGFLDLVYFLGFVFSSSLCSLEFSSGLLFLLLDYEVSWFQAIDSQSLFSFIGLTTLVFCIFPKISRFPALQSLKRFGKS